SGEGDLASLVVFVGPAWELQSQNPLRGSLPVLAFAPPDRTAIRDTLNRLHPLNGDAEACVDALCGLSADSAEQAAAEVLARTGGKYDPALLRESKRAELRRAGLEVWPAVADLGGLAGLRETCESEVIPWLRDPQLSLRRILCAGLPGMGKSYFARWLAQRIGAECVRMSIPALKAGVVGASESNLRRALAVLDAMGRDSPLVCVLDEIDTIARDGMDGGTSSGMFAELLTWLQESTSQTVVVATLNRLDKLDAALESRFALRFFFDLGTRAERESVAAIHYGRLQCADAATAARVTADYTDGYSSREIAEQICPSVARQTGRKPDATSISRVIAGITPSSKTQADQLQQMRRAAATLRRANDPEDEAPSIRRIAM
ncbi:MAG: ATP-binding protein, partial [Gemmataceae bacterium]